MKCVGSFACGCCFSFFSLSSASLPPLVFSRHGSVKVGEGEGRGGEGEEKGGGRH